MGEFPLFLSRLWQFSRPHTIVGTSLSVFALYFIALTATHPKGWAGVGVLTFSHLGAFLGAWIACIGGNIFIVGLNQLYDVEIDRINKPQLPLASGALTLNQGRWIVGISGGVGIIVSVLLSPWLFGTVAVSVAIGTAYSMPPLRLKRFSLLAALCILTVRGAVVNMGLFGYFSQTFGNQVVFTPALIILTLFILFFSIAIAIFKDVPDTEGDQIFQIQTFSLILGQETVFHLTRWIISIVYGVTIVAGIYFFPGMNGYFFMGYHALLLLLFGRKSQAVDLDNKNSIVGFYQLIWKLFFLEYILFPMACLLSLTPQY